MYSPTLRSRSEFLSLRGLRMHVRHWGHEGAPRLFMLHGWMDVSASFQFVVDSLAREWHVIAPDWRGFGLSERSDAGCYWFPDYLADLEALLDHYAGDQPIDLLGHSMGGNVACLYAGVRPRRVARLINLEGFGLPTTQPRMAPGRYAKWLDELRAPPAMRAYASRDEVAARLMKTNPRIPLPRAQFLAGHWAAPDERDEWQILGDAAHKLTNPVLYQTEEVLACWENITAPVLWVEADNTDIWRWMGEKSQARAEIDRRRACIPKVRAEVIADAGHMLHHDQPEALARLIEAFLD
ncbi:MAG: alpha/beta fold hydrolase [Oxalobacteraceae bacterium]